MLGAYSLLELLLELPELIKLSSADGDNLDLSIRPRLTTLGNKLKSVAGGYLLQTRDNGHLAKGDLKVVTRRAPTAQELDDLLFAFTVAKHVKSKSIVYARNGQTLGIGAGQMNRKDSARIAALRAADFGLDLKGSACASEAFFPFPDGLIQAADAGCTAVIQPGGSIGDQKVIDAADERGITMVVTGVRVFRH